MRFTPIPADSLHASQRSLHEAFTRRILTNYREFGAIRADGALLGPWGVWLQVPKAGEAIRQLMEAVAAMPGISGRSAQAISLLTTAHFRAVFEVQVHATLGARLGLTASQIERLCDGAVPDDLDADTTACLHLAEALLSGGVVPEATFRHALDKIGLEGIYRIAFQVGLYCSVSITLNAFDIPAPR